MAVNEVINALVTGGIGAAVGSIAVAVINSWSKKGESRAAAADLVTNASVGLIDRLEKTNTRLDGENKHLRSAILTLTDAVDECLTVAAEPNPSPIALERVRAKLREANREAKMVV